MKAGVEFFPHAAAEEKLESGSDMKSFVQRPGGRPAAEREGFEFLRGLSLHPHGDLSGTCRGSYPVAGRRN